MCCVFPSLSFSTTMDRSVRASVYARTSLSTLCLHWTGSTTAQPALVALNVSFRCTIHSHSMSPRCFIHTTSYTSSPPPCQARASCWGSSRPPSSRLLSPVRSGTLSLSHTHVVPLPVLNPGSLSWWEQQVSSKIKRSNKAEAIRINSCQAQEAKVSKFLNPQPSQARLSQSLKFRR